METYDIATTSSVTSIYIGTECMIFIVAITIWINSYKYMKKTRLVNDFNRILHVETTYRPTELDGHSMHPFDSL